MQTVSENITVDELRQMSQKMYNQLVKAVVDIKTGIMVVDAGLHADEEDLLLENGSDQEDLWGINLINIRPSWGNSSRGVESLDIQKKIISIVDKLVVA